MLEFYLTQSVSSKKNGTCESIQNEMTLTFPDFDAVNKWIFSLMRRPYSEPGTFNFPDFDKIRADKYYVDPWADSWRCKELPGYNQYTIRFKPKRIEEVWSIHMICYYREDEFAGILYSDGYFTSGQEHMGDAVKQWSADILEEAKHPVFKFINTMD